MSRLQNWQATRREVKRLDRDAEPEVLGPPEAFDDRRPDDAFRKRWHPRHNPLVPRAGLNPPTSFRRTTRAGTRVRGAGVKAVSPAQRGRSGATRLDGGEHTRTLWV